MANREHAMLAELCQRIENRCHPYFLLSPEMKGWWQEEKKRRRRPYPEPVPPITGENEF